MQVMGHWDGNLFLSDSGKVLLLFSSYCNFSVSSRLFQNKTKFLKINKNHYRGSTPNQVHRNLWGENHYSKFFCLSLHFKRHLYLKNQTFHPATKYKCQATSWVPLNHQLLLSLKAKEIIHILSHL